VKTGSSFTVKQFSGGFLSIFNQRFAKIYQWLLHFGKIQWSCHPVIHFGIDIYGEITEPWWNNIIAPDSLQIGSLGSWSGR
jgi:hypothetical protein